MTPGRWEAAQESHQMSKRSPTGMVLIDVVYEYTSKITL